MNSTRILVMNAKGVQRELTERTWHLMSSMRERGNTRRGWTLVKRMEPGEKSATESADKVAVMGAKGPTFIPKEIEEAAKIKAEEASRNAGAKVTMQEVLQSEQPPAPAPATAPAQPPSPPASEAAGVADDMTKLPHIGAKSAAALRSIGIDSFAKLIEADSAAIEKALDGDNLGPKKALIGKWKEAARAAVNVPA